MIFKVLDKYKVFRKKEKMLRHHAGTYLINPDMRHNTGGY